MIANKLGNLSVVLMLLIAVSMIKPERVYAQQDPLYTHYMFNKMVYNPAYTGINREFICATFLLHRSDFFYSTTVTAVIPRRHDTGRGFP